MKRVVNFNMMIVSTGIRGQNKK